MSSNAPGATTFLPNGALENSGSLTGHILNQGAADTPPPKARTARVVIIIMIIIVALVVGGIAAAIFAQEAINDLFEGLFAS